MSLRELNKSKSEAISKDNGRYSLKTFFPFLAVVVAIGVAILYGNSEDILQRFSQPVPQSNATYRSYELVGMLWSDLLCFIVTMKMMLMMILNMIYRKSY